MLQHQSTHTNHTAILWLRCCATSQTVPGSIPGRVTGFFSNISPSDHSMALGSAQTLLKMSTTNIPGCKGGQCVRLTISPPSCAECHEIWERKPPGTLWATPGLLLDSFTLVLLVSSKLCFISDMNSDSAFLYQTLNKQENNYHHCSVHHVTPYLCQRTIWILDNSHWTKIM